MEFLPVKLNVFSGLCWFGIVLLFVGISKGMGTAVGANFFISGILIGFPAYLGGILWKSFQPSSGGH